MRKALHPGTLHVGALGTPLQALVAFWGAANGVATNGGLKGVCPPFLKIGLNGLFSPFSAFFALFRRVRRAFPGKSRKRRKEAFFLRYPPICSSPHVLNPPLQHSGGPPFTKCLRIAQPTSAARSKFGHFPSQRADVMSKDTRNPGRHLQECSGTRAGKCPTEWLLTAFQPGPLSTPVNGGQGRKVFLQTQRIFLQKNALSCRKMNFPRIKTASAVHKKEQSLQALLLRTLEKAVAVCGTLSGAHSVLEPLRAGQEAHKGSS